MGLKRAIGRIGKRYWISSVALLFFVVHLYVSQIPVPAAASNPNWINGSMNDIASDGQPKQGDRKLNMIESTTWSKQQQVPPSPVSSDSSSSSSGRPESNLAALERFFGGENLLKLGQDNQLDDAGQSEDELFLARQEIKYKIRNERVKEVCRRRGVVKSKPVSGPSTKEAPKLHGNQEVERPNITHFTVASSFQTMGCFLNKVASSSLVSAFLLVSGFEATFSSPHSLAPLLQPKSVEEFLYSNSSYFKFMFVRHPMERLLSCYMDKMVESPHWSLPAFRRHVRDMGRQIMKRRRGQSPKANDRPAVPALLSPNSAATAVDQSHIQIVNSQIKDKANGTALTNGQTDVKPTFEEFLEFILDTDLQGVGYDSHWVPFFRYCTPCSVPYHVIGKLETGVEDFKYIWTKTGLVSKVPIPWVNRVIAPSKSKINLEKRHYSSLPRELILRVYSRFQLDFELYDYSINEVLLKAGYDPIVE